MIRLVAADPAVRLDEQQCLWITFWLLEFVPATHCQVTSAPPVEITITGHHASQLHPPLLEKVQKSPDARSRYRWQATIDLVGVASSAAVVAALEPPAQGHDHVSAHQRKSFCVKWWGRCLVRRLSLHS